MQEGVFKGRERNVNSGRFKCVMAVLGRCELTLLKKQFVGLFK
jgi:hypothetical protein